MRFSKKNLNCEYNTKLLEDMKVTDEVKDLIRNLLVLDYKKRLNAEKALNHKCFKIWEYKKKHENSFDHEIIDSLKRFANKNLFQKEILFFLAKLSDDEIFRNSKERFLKSIKTIREQLSMRRF